MKTQPLFTVLLTGGMTGIWVILASISYALAEGGRCDGDRKVAVNVRMVHAFQTDRAVAAAKPPTNAHMRIDGRLQDVSAKLAGLPFHSFHLVFSERRILGMKKKEVFNLAGGQTLALRPIYADSSKIGLWLKWMDAQGEDVLDTRLHFDPGQSMIAGTEQTQESGLVLVLDASLLSTGNPIPATPPIE